MVTTRRLERLNPNVIALNTIQTRPPILNGNLLKGTRSALRVLKMRKNVYLVKR
jgi:hypothetical protein